MVQEKYEKIERVTPEIVRLTGIDKDSILVFFKQINETLFKLNDETFISKICEIISRSQIYANKVSKVGPTYVKGGSPHISTKVVEDSEGNRIPLSKLPQDAQDLYLRLRKNG